MSDKHVHLKNKYISKAIELTDKLLDVSEMGTKEVGDDFSMIFFGTIRDCAFKIKKLADELLKKEKNN